ncbi:hypothetical protein BO79DRAFT_250423 [Aspergillus costaricaensis CBS 115574]|uniref:Uncharacterized protein n=1 Tax=Aspergillus costaricaensis CBS 115574 TaxID=1448317 RepID=A0ACD1IVW6_9EURO|nr:hypothetical protein BO79DRAFT_250423 [Aspergillus costaricaensis CBS 115574]RAK93800.1 hypothetical protein BO79DRAFT_250423 [Aspergillus costaricaensis CBS 115574]
MPWSIDTSLSFITLLLTGISFLLKIWNHVPDLPPMPRLSEDNNDINNINYTMSIQRFCSNLGYIPESTKH